MKCSELSALISSGFREAIWPARSDLALQLPSSTVVLQVTPKLELMFGPLLGLSSKVELW